MKEIPLTQNRVALVDDADYEWLSQWNWHAHHNHNEYTYYVRRKQRIEKKLKTILMHREILSATPSDVVDHIDGNGLNNQRHNLRLCTRAQNALNSAKRNPSRATSQYKGVVKQKGIRKWYAQIKIDGRQVTLGSYDTEEGAALAYNVAALKYHKEFARLNRIDNILNEYPDLLTNEEEMV